MSIHSMTNVALVRKVPSQTPEQGVTSDAGQAAAMGYDPARSVTAALNVITAYIPTEVITLYVAVVAALQSETGAVPQTSVLRIDWINFYIFLAVTPLVVWIIYAGKRKNQTGMLPLSPRAWPKWEMFAATVAFSSWAFALPNTPFQNEAFYNPAVAGLVVVVTSTLLGLVSPLWLNRPVRQAS